MPKKKKKKVSKRVKPRVKKKAFKNILEKELIFKTKPEWVKSALIK